MATSLICGGNQSCMHFYKTLEKNTRSTFDKFDMDADLINPQETLKSLYITKKCFVRYNCYNSRFRKFMYKVKNLEKYYN